jgi:hypothetical protein
MERSKWHERQHLAQILMSAYTSKKDANRVRSGMAEDMRGCQ